MAALFYAISNRKETQAIVCTFHLPRALKIHEWSDAYRLDPTLIDGDPRCDLCATPEPPVTDRELIDAIRSELTGNPDLDPRNLSYGVAVPELRRRYPAIEKVLDHFMLHGKSSGLRYGEVVIFAVLEEMAKQEVTL